MHTIGLSLNMPAHRSGVLGLGVELLAPAFPPARPQSATTSARIPDGAVAVHLPLRLSPAEPLAFRWRCWALVGGPGGAPVRAIGDWREAEAAQLTPRPDQLPLGFARVSASPALLAVAAIALRLEGRVGDADFVLAERLDAARPSVALALPPGLEDARLALFADSLDGGEPVALPDQPAADAWLDLHLLPGFAPQACTLQLDAAVAAPGHLEWCDAARRDAPGASRLQPLAPGDNACTLRWLPADPLRPAIVWRLAAAPGAAPASWSAPLSPGTHRIALDAAAPTAGPTPKPSPTPTEPAMDPIVFDAVAAFPVAGEPLHYQLLPLRPGLARTPAGAPQLQLLEAGALRLLQLTAAWGLAADEVDAARAALAGRLGVAPERLVLDERPATVAAYELWLAGEDGAPALASSARGSGMGAQHAVFSLPLYAEHGARMRRALKGTRGQAWLRARFTASPDAARTSTSVAVDTLWTRSALIDGVASAAATAVHAEAHQASTPETPLPAADADAADWTRPR
jgi:hypothetical protein